MGDNVRSKPDDAREQHWLKLIAAVRNLKAAKVWYDYKHKPCGGPDDEPGTLYEPEAGALVQRGKGRASICKLPSPPKRLITLRKRRR